MSSHYWTDQPGTHGILDTNILIDLSLIKNPDSLPAQPLISAIPLAELSVGPMVATTREEQLARQVFLQQVEATFEPLPFDAHCARAFAIVAAELRAKGKKSKTKAFDALIAATAIATDLPLYTNNVEDFAGISQLTVIPVDLDGS